MIGVIIIPGKTGVPLLPNEVGTFECDAYGWHDGGDHEIFVGRVVELAENIGKRGRRLVFFGGRYRRLAADGGHAVPSEADFFYGWQAATVRAASGKGTAWP